jgi:ParB family chromosome partitioning protein
MARKNIFGLGEPDSAAAADIDDTLTNARPLAGFEKPLRRASPVGAISQSTKRLSVLMIWKGNSRRG